MVYNEPDWSGLSLPELLEKAREFSEKAYTGSLSSSAFLMRSLERLSPGSDLGAEIVTLLDKMRAINNDLIELKRGIEQAASKASPSAQ